MPRVLVTPSMLQHAPGRHRELLEAAGFELVFPPTSTDRANASALIEVLQGIDCTLASIENYSPEVLAATNLRAIARMGVGYDAIDVPAATGAGVVVTITPGANEQSVAELAIAMICALSRGFPRRDLGVRRGEWDRTAMPRLGGQTLGLVGLGRIGRAVAVKAAALGLKILASDPFADETYARQQNIELVSFDDLLAQSDYVSLHLPSTAETENLICAETLAKMKPGAVLVNTSRGGLVDEDALVAALRDKHISAAGLDVFKVEPLPMDSPLREFDNVLLSPHTGGLDEESTVAMAVMAAESLVELYQGRWPEHQIVNRELGPDWKW